MSPQDLAQVLRYLKTDEKLDPNLLVGIEHSDDGGVYQLSDDLALIQSLDFFTPIVDDPYMFGQIAAANALSDIYAMGGTPKTVLNIVAFPVAQFGPKILAKILQGSHDKVKEAGAQVLGGHSIEDNEPKFGLSVTGIVHPTKYYKNIGAKPNDLLVLTKPIGVGIQTTALKQGKLKDKYITNITETMRSLNKNAAEILNNFQPNAVTDVTGFGLLGHAFEMAHGSQVSFEIDWQRVPLLAGTQELAEQHLFPGGSRANHEWLKQDIHYNDKLTEIEQLILCDAVTSGGLLISLPENEAKNYVNELSRKHNLQANIIGKVTKQQKHTIYVSK